MLSYSLTFFYGEDIANKKKAQPTVALAAVRSKAKVILLWIHCSMLLQLLIEGCVWPLFCNVT